MASTIAHPSFTEETQAEAAQHDSEQWQNAQHCGQVIQMRSPRDTALDELAAIIDYLRANPGLPLPYIRWIEVSATRDEVEQVAEISGQPIDTSGSHPSVIVPFGDAAYRVFHVSDEQMAAHYAWSTDRGAVRPESESA
ncbi:MAG: hypothetical protein JWO67_934 [Streptosporangiaceae bacterium]|nr:hypothetical protein [Streptosporangiaceae bacterium]